MTPAALAAIEARAAAVFREDAPWDGYEADRALPVVTEDVPALAAELRRLQAEAAAHAAGEAARTAAAVEAAVRETQRRCVRICESVALAQPDAHERRDLACYAAEAIRDMVLSVGDDADAIAATTGGG